MRDDKAPGLRARTTAASVKSFVNSAKLSRQTICRSTGDVRALSNEANRLSVTLDGDTGSRKPQTYGINQSKIFCASPLCQFTSAAEQ